MFTIEMERGTAIQPLEYVKSTKTSKFLSKLLSKPYIPGCWKPAKALNPRKSVPLMALKIVTLNVWFDAHLSALRWQQSFNNIQLLNADVICFQEVTKKFLEQMSQQPYIQNDYYCSDVDGSTFLESWYGCCVIVKKEILMERPRIHNLKFEGSKMGRGLLSIDVLVCNRSNNNISITIGTSHLESRHEDWIERQKQLQTITKKMPNNSIFCGDLNIYDDEQESAFISNLGWSDSFKTLGIEGPGITWGKWTFPKNDDSPGRRLDRILYKECDLKPMNYGTFGQNEIKGVDVIYPSDHLGVTVGFEL